MKKILALCLSGLLLVGCSASSTPTTKTCTSTVDNDTVVIKGSGDTLESMSETFTMDISDYDDATQQSVVDSVADSYGGYNGVSYETSLDNGILTITVTFDLKTATQADLVALGIADAADGEGDYSVEATVQNFEAQGYTCK